MEEVEGEVFVDEYGNVIDEEDDGTEDKDLAAKAKALMATSVGTHEVNAQCKVFSNFSPI